MNILLNSHIPQAIQRGLNIHITRDINDTFNQFIGSLLALLSRRLVITTKAVNIIPQQYKKARIDFKNIMLKVLIMLLKLGILL